MLYAVGTNMGRNLPELWKGELKVSGVGIEIGRGQSEVCNQLSLQLDTPITHTNVETTLPSEVEIPDS